MSKRALAESLRVPAALRHAVEEILKVTEPFCAEHLDQEYGELVAKLVAKLARKRPSPLERGDLTVWAGAAIYAIGSVNFLFDKAQRPHLTGDDLSRLTGVPKSTLANKAKVIRDLLRLGQLDPEFCRRELLLSNPMAWMISVNGFIVDARTMPPEVQAEARRLGLIPDLPVDREAQGQRRAPTPGGDAPLKGLAEAVDDVVDIIRQAPASGGGASDAWDRVVRLFTKQDWLPNSDLEIVEEAIDRAYGRWSDAERRSIWSETDGVMEEKDDDAPYDMSFDEIGPLRAEMLEVVTRAARRDADAMLKAERKRARGKSPRTE